MKVYFAPCGIGLGHVGRCVPIAKKLLERRAEVLFSTYCEGMHYVKRERLPLVEAPPIGFRVRPDGSVDFRQTAINPGPFVALSTLLKQVNAEIRSIESTRPDIVVSDSRISPLLAARVLRTPRVCILNQFQVMIPRKKRFLRSAKLVDFGALTLIGKIWTSGNVLLIPDFPEPYTVSAGNLIIPKYYRRNVKLIGPILPVRPEDLPDKAKLRRKLNLPVDKPLIFAPISGPVRERAFLTGLLRKIFLQFPEDFEVVMSLGYPNADSDPIRHENVVIRRWIPNRFEYLKACDLVIARAGHGTLTQCICYGKPMIIVPTPNHTEQLVNAQQVETLGIAKIVFQEELTRDTLLKNVEDILHGELVEKASQIQGETAQFKGIENAVEAIIETAEGKQVF